MPKDGVKELHLSIWKRFIVTLSEPKSETICTGGCQIASVIVTPWHLSRTFGQTLQIPMGFALSVLPAPADAGDSGAGSREAVKAEDPEAGDLRRKKAPAIFQLVGDGVQQEKDLDLSRLGEPRAEIGADELELPVPLRGDAGQPPGRHFDFHARFPFLPVWPPDVSIRMAIQKSKARATARLEAISAPTKR